MATKKTNYIEMELKWLEDQAAQLREYCQEYRIVEIRDRIVNRRLMATIEIQIKSRRDSLQDYIKIVEAIDKLKERDAVKKESVRGDVELSPLESGDLV